MSVQRVSHPGQPTRLIDEGPASVAVDAFSAIGSLSASAVRETVPLTGGAGSVQRSNGHSVGPFADLTQAANAADEAWRRKQAADAAWDIARAALTAAWARVAPMADGAPVVPVAAVPEPVQMARGNSAVQSRQNGTTAMLAKRTEAKKRTISPEGREAIRQGALRRRAREQAEREAAS